MTRKFIFLLLLVAINIDVSSAGTPIDGRWLTANGNGWIDIRTEGQATAGFIAGSPNDPAKEKPEELDVYNPDPALRFRPLTGMQIISDVSQKSETQWRASIYDPNSGKTYKCTLTLADADTLKLRGYVGIPLFGRTETWTRVN